MRKKRYYRQKNIGLERALKHIEEANILSEELGGTDKDVKEYFFSLPENKLKKLFRDYGKKYGEDVKDYAIETFPQWRSGKRKMSGLVASRLYSMLPPMMPIDTKYSMVKVLWDKYGPSTNKILMAGDGSTASQIHSHASKYLLKTITDWEVSPNLKKRFNWLSSGDVQIQEKLLNHFKDLEKKQIINGLKKKMPVLLEFTKSNQDITGSLTETINIGNHKLKIKFDLEAQGIEFIDPQDEIINIEPESNNSFIWIGLILVVIVLLLMNS